MDWKEVLMYTLGILFTLAVTAVVGFGFYYGILLMIKKVFF